MDGATQEDKVATLVEILDQMAEYGTDNRGPRGPDGALGADLRSLDGRMLVYVPRVRDAPCPRLSHGLTV